VRLSGCHALNLDTAMPEKVFSSKYTKKNAKEMQIDEETQEKVVQVTV